MPRPSSIALTMLAKLSSVSTMSAASLETSVPVIPMATPILAALSAGASLMPSPVMATMWPLRCRAPTIRSLCSGSTRANTRTCSTIASSSASPMVRRSAPVTRRAPGSKMLELVGDCLGGRRMVARDHHRADMRPLGDGDGRLRLRPGRIDHADKAEQHEVVLDAVGKLDRRRAVGDGLGIETQGGRRHGARGNGQASAAPGPPGLRCAVRAPRGGPRRAMAALPSSQPYRHFAEQDFGAPLTKTQQFAGLLEIDDERSRGACART